MPRLAEQADSVPGLTPDVAVGDTRLRALARDGFLLVGGEPAPGVRTLPLDGAVAEVLGARQGEVWVIRPDAHVAAVVPQSAVRAALTQVTHPVATSHTAEPV